MVAKVRTNCYIIYVNNLTRTLNMRLELSYTRPTYHRRGWLNGELQVELTHCLCAA